MNICKSAKDSITEHISKFSTLLNIVMSYLNSDVRYNDPRKNNLFLNSLELSHIPNEDWSCFITSLGKTWLELPINSLYSVAQTYYMIHMQPQINKSAADIPIADDPAKVLATSSTR